MFLLLSSFYDCTELDYRETRKKTSLIEFCACNRILIGLSTTKKVEKTKINL